MARSAIVARHNIKKERTIEDYERVRNDWYLEPVWASELLFKTIKFDRMIYDPCCGQGNILKAAFNCGYSAEEVWGTDIVYRGFGAGGLDADFLKRGNLTPNWNIVMNPPYELAEEFILHALKLTTAKVAALVNIKFLASQGRYDRLFAPHPPETVLILSRRPSMPPGGIDIPAQGGTADYCWIIFDEKALGPPLIKWVK